MSKYDDIINLPRPVSKNHIPMSMHDRAAQFSPFAALTGFDDTIKESNRITGKFVELSDDEKAELDNVLSCLKDKEYSSPTLSITYFVPDLKKDGGEYVSVSGKLKKIDTIDRKLILYKDFKIDIDKINDITLMDEDQK